MKNIKINSIVLLILFLLVNVLGQSQTKNIKVGGFELQASTVDSELNSLFCSEGIIPVFPGGMDSLISFANRNLNYPETAIKDSIEGRVLLEFIVDTNGNVTDEKVIVGVRTDLDTHCLSMLKKMPKWEAGRIEEEAVAVKFLWPIKFILTEEGDEKTKFQDEILNGKIKTIKQIIYEKDRVDTALYFFNEVGLLEEAITNGFRDIHSYNWANQKIKSTSFDLNHGGIELQSNEYLYENENLITHILKYPSSTFKITYYYDYFITYYTYNINKQLVEEKKFSKRKEDTKEMFCHRYTYQYDSIGNRTIVEKFEENGSMWEKIENKYRNNKLIETFTWTSFEGEDLYLKDIYVYNENDKLESLINIVYNYGSTTDIQHSDTTNYLYDDQQRLIKIIEPRNFIYYNLTSFSDFDIKGNWQQKTIVDTKKIIREIEYYNE